MAKAPHFWHAPSWQAFALWPLSRLYWCIAKLRLTRHTPFRVSVPVICVGNNTVGGSGKTPLVLACAAILSQHGYKPAILSRGYKGNFTGALRVDSALHSAQDVGDEPLLMAQHAACYVSTSRLHSARAAIADGADCLLLDDGMQNPSLHKDLTLMVIDGAYGFGNGLMLPAGPRREPLAQSLSKASAIVIMGEATHLDVKNIIAAAQAGPVFHASLQLQAALPTGALAAFCGIGRPEKFFASLQQQGAQLVQQTAFADHHAYTEAELHTLEEAAQQQGAQLITTEKDWMRLDASWRKKVRYVPVAAVLQEAEAFAQLLLNAVQRRGD